VRISTEKPNKDPRRNLPKGYFLKNDEEASKRILPFISGRDIFIILALFVGWGLVGFFLVYQSKKVSQAVISHPAVLPEKISISNLELPDIPGDASSNGALEDISIDDSEIFDTPPTMEDLASPIEKTPIFTNTLLSPGKITQPDMEIQSSKMRELLAPQTNPAPDIEETQQAAKEPTSEDTLKEEEIKVESSEPSPK